MVFPLSLSDINLWIAITALILLITTESLLSQHGKLTFLVDKARLRFVAFLLGVAFMVTVIIRVLTPPIV